MKKTVLGALLMTMVSLVFAAGDVLTMKPGHPQTYVVKKGDTLWDISGMYLTNPWMWPEIWHVNPQVDNPHLIFPGDTLNLVYINGKPKLVVKRGGDVKLSPEIHVSTIDSAIPAIPLDAISPFLSNSRVVDPSLLRDAPYVLSGKEGHIIAGAGDELFARGDFSGGHEAYGIYRPGNEFKDPDTGEGLGLQAKAIASGKVVGKENDLATLILNSTSEEVRRSDRLLVEEERTINANFYPAPAPDGVNGYIIAVEGGVSQIGAMDVVVINKGKREKIEVGQVFSIYRKGDVVRDEVRDELVKTPDARAGLLMVFRTFDKVSYAIVLKATRPLSVMDRVREP